MNGFEAVTAIRAREMEECRHLLIIAQIAHSVMADSERCLATGLAGYLFGTIQHAPLRQVSENAHSAVAALPVAPVAETAGDGVFDRAAALARVDGDVAFLQELFVLFQRDVPCYLGEIHSALAAGDASQARRPAHTLKGAIANFAAAAAYEAAEQMEMIAGSSDLVGALAHCAVLEKEIERLEVAFTQEMAPAM